MKIHKALATAALSGLIFGSLVACSGDAKPDATPAADVPAAAAPAAPGGDCAAPVFFYRDDTRAAAPRR